MSLRDTLDELQSLDPNNPGAWPTIAYALACLIVLLVLSVGGYYYLITPKLETLDRIQREEQALRQDFEQKQRKVAALGAYRAQLEEMERSFGSMLRQLPSKSEVANLLNDISQTRIAAGLEEELFEPRGEVRRDFYAELPNKIVVTGNYHQIADFVSRVSSLPRIVTVNDVSLRRAGDQSGKLRMEATIKTYRYIDEEGGGR